MKRSTPVAMVKGDLVVELEPEPLSDFWVCVNYVAQFTASYSFSAQPLPGYVLISNNIFTTFQSPRAVATPDLIKTENANQQVLL